MGVNVIDTICIYTVNVTSFCRFTKTLVTNWYVTLEMCNFWFQDSGVITWIGYKSATHILAGVAVSSLLSLKESTVGHWMYLKMDMFRQSAQQRVILLSIYSCRPGYVLEGGSIRVCDHYGSWTGSMPVCRSMLEQILTHYCIRHLEYNIVIMLLYFLYYRNQL